MHDEIRYAQKKTPKAKLIKENQWIRLKINNWIQEKNNWK